MMRRHLSSPSKVFPGPGRGLGRAFRILAVALVLSAAAAAPVPAIQIDSAQVVVPVIVHIKGYNDTEWWTDLWITNPFGNSLDVKLSYYPSAGGMLTKSLSLDPYASLYLQDIVLQTFSLNSSKGVLMVSAPAGSVEVRARVYNTGNSVGEFGQALPGLPLDRLSHESFISGVSTAAGTRLSVGVANTSDSTLRVFIKVNDDTGARLAGATVTVGPHQLVQLDRVADLWDLPQRDSLTLDLITVGGDSGSVFYGYASVVREDTGDATFLFGTTPAPGPA